MIVRCTRIQMRTRVMQCRAKLSVAAVLLGIGFLTTAYCQETGALKGTVEDSTGAAVIGAHVTLKHSAAGKLHSLTDEDGYFDMAKLPAGQYVLTVEAPGFETWEKTIEVGPKPAGAGLIRMKLPQFQQEVTVQLQAQP